MSEAQVREWRRVHDPGELVSSGRIETLGGHDYVGIWVRGCKVGELVMDIGDGARFLAQLGLLPPEPRP